MVGARVRGLARGRGGLVTVVTIAALLVGIGATLFGLGASNNAIANFDAASWLWSTNKGEVARVNGVTGRVDTRYKVSDSFGHTVQVSQTDRYVILRDVTTGKVSVLDLASLHLAASTRTTAGVGVTVALHGESAFVIDAVQGAVSQLDPATLTPVGAPLRFMPGLSGGAFDAAGRLWLLVPREGTAVAIQPTAPPSSRSTRGGRAGTAAPADPRVVKTVAVADPSHDLALSVLDSGVAVLDKTASVLATLRDDVVRKTPLNLTGPGALPPRTTGTDVPVTVVDGRTVYVVNGDRVGQFTVPGEGAKLAPCVAWSKRLYCADETTGDVYVLDTAGRLATTITVPGAAGTPLDLEVREDHLFINAPAGSNAEVVDDQGRARLVDKYANNILGGDPPPPPPPPPPPQKPPVGPPGAPVNVRAAAGNAQARVSWGAAPSNGAPVMKYVVEGDGKPHEVGADQRSLDVTGLANGQTYTFTVYAVNAKGSGPKRAANPVVPTAEVPDAPTSVAATENSAGTVAVTWPAANGQGRGVARYVVSAIAAGSAPVQVGDTDRTTLTVPAGTQLTYGTQYAFTVIAVNDRGANSKPSPLSNTVVPYAAPGRPVGLDARTATDRAGTVTVTWRSAPENGRPISRYVVTANGRGQDVVGATSTTLTGFGNGTRVNVAVHAVNAAGAGPDATTTATTITAPKVTVTGSSAASTTSIAVTFSADLGGASGATCTLAVSGGPSASNACRSSALTVGGLAPSRSYGFTVTVTTPAGSASATGSQATADVYGQAYCQNYVSTSDPATQTWCNDQRNALEVQPSPAVLHQNTVGKTTHLASYKAYCWTTGESVYAYNYNHDKRTNRWIRIEWNGGQYYTPLAWINFDGNTSSDYVGVLPHC
ncbi:fibronectin type III domain-containing protein [Planosporangium thailandense]|uniref:Fibronectin type III domain-containing protein n=1 Tax=Planosporangium thailandense TaxID=765197 RepID=A0ABX0XYP8_9ACTN|nr:fibronectin type III domain-containing protein [Planosporangium thailandense]NJC70328.1 fibronectin type III domain-containing protein [Planosporangium thailandense]